MSRAALPIPVAIALAAGGFALMVVGYAVASSWGRAPTPGKTGNANVATIPTDWKTYSGMSLGFSFRYPSDWAVVTPSDPKAGIVLRSPNGGEIYLKSLSNPSDLTVEQLFSSFDDTSRFWFGKYPHSARAFGPNQGVAFHPFSEANTTPERIEVLTSPPNPDRSKLEIGAL